MDIFEVCHCCGADDQVRDDEDDEDDLACRASASILHADPLASNHLESTPLFDAIQRMDWDAVDSLLESGFITQSPFQSDEQEGSPIAAAEDQVETWIVCDNDEGHLIWRQLPIHAAICYGAPIETIKELVGVYPAGVCCADAEGNLPIHLAVKFNRSHKVLLELLRSFPDTFHAQNCKGRTPLEMGDIDKEEGGKDRYKVLKTFMECQKSLAKKEQEKKQEEVKDMYIRAERASLELVKAQREVLYLTKFPIHKQVNIPKRRRRFSKLDSFSSFDSLRMFKTSKSREMETE